MSAKCRRARAIDRGLSPSCARRESSVCGFDGGVRGLVGAVAWGRSEVARDLQTRSQGRTRQGPNM
eukprot:3792410-Prymnesium_polylepis.1